MQRPSPRGKHKKEGTKKYQERASEEEMTDARGEIEAQPVKEGTQEEKLQLMQWSTRLSDQATKKQEELMMEEEDKANNPFLILQMDEEEESEDEGMEDRADEMQVASLQRSP